MARRFCVGGNWKMNGDKKSITLICRNLVAGPLDPNTEVVVGCPAVYLEHARSLLPAEIGVAGQVNRIPHLLNEKPTFTSFLYDLHQFWMHTLKMQTAHTFSTELYYIT